ncbi:MAG: hypothetical protein IKW83_09070 [Muribaculaceae bacterium]|nr:hypothetical protein [Muribaculaceae bacterium]
MDYILLSTILARGEKSISPRALYRLQQPLVEELIQWRDSGSTGQKLTEQSIEISSNEKQIRLLDASSDEAQNIVNYGSILLAAIDHSTLRDKRLRRIAEQCARGEVANLETLHLMLERMVSSTIYRLLLAVILTGIAILATYQILH